MTRRLAVQWLRGAVVALCVGGCAVPRQTGEALAPNALSSSVVWTATDIQADTSPLRGPVGVVDIQGGEIVRLEVRSDALIEIAERTMSGTNTVESWSSYTPSGGVVLVRPSAFATALAFSRGAIERAERGHGSDPGYYWFALEDRVVEWANGPIPAPFPAIAPSDRIDLKGFAALDAALADAIRSTPEVGKATDWAHAVRATVGLRAVRALRPPTGYPYFFDSEPPLRSTTAAPGRPIELDVTGPLLLHVWANVAQPQAGEVELRIFEGGRLRAESALSTPRRPSTYYDAQPSAAVSRWTRRAVVHVPPGRHSYRLESTAPVRVAPLLASPVVHFEDASAKNEAVLLERAHGACEARGSPAICAMSLALLGADDEDPRGAWAHAVAESKEGARLVALELAKGGPRDPLPALSARAARGDPEALNALDGLVAASVDSATRAAWVHAVARGSEWRALPTGSDAAPWASVRTDGPVSAHCGTGSFDEIGANDARYLATTWQGAKTLELLVVAACADAQPVELVVDGQHLTAAPGSPQARWHIRVHGDVAVARRSDHSSARVYALPASEGPCKSTWFDIHPPVVAATQPQLKFGGLTRGLGVEVWLREGAPLASVTVEPLSGPAPDVRESPLAPPRTRIVAPSTSGLSALDRSGIRWTRVARVALPEWAAAGVRVAGGAEVAVRPLARLPVTSAAPARPRVVETQAIAAMNEAALVAVSRRILGAPVERRGALYLERAYLLAEQGARVAAVADARTAQAFGVKTASGEEPEVAVARQVRARPFTVEPMPETISAYGVEPDFDPDARTCTTSNSGPRARFVAALARFPKPTQGSLPRPFDVEDSSTALAAAQESASDPRAAGLAVRALAGSRWKLDASIGHSANHVRRERELGHNGPVDPEGKLRARVLVGSPFEKGTYATVTADRAAGAVLPAVAPSTNVRLDLACAARAPELATHPQCDLAVSFDGKPLAVTVDGEGHASLPLPTGAGPRRVDVSVKPDPGDWVALVRIRTDHAIPNAQRAGPSEWVIAPHEFEWRTLVAPGHTLALDAPTSAILRIDAQEESPASAEVEIRVQGDKRGAAIPGRPLIVPLPAGRRVELDAIGGPVSVTIASRIRDDRPAQAQTLAGLPSHIEAPSGPVHGVGSLAADGAWRMRTQSSPPPLSPLEAALGTVVAETGVVYGNVRQDWVQSAPPEWFVFGLAGYRRRIESIGLWTRGDVFIRTREGEPTYGAVGSLYESIEAMHLRFFASLAVEAQHIAGTASRSLLAHVFAEYSQRVSRSVFILPRIGYDGMYTTVPRRPTALSYVDDEVYNPYRSLRPTFLFGQLLFWWAPYFDEIVFMRLRGAFNPSAGVASYATVAPGAFLALGALDLSGSVAFVWYPPADSLMNTGHVTETAGLEARYAEWFGWGSLGLQPGVAALGRVQDAGWQVTAFVNLLASYRRGLRDFSSLELDFPEQFSGGIPWRGNTPGGYR